MAGIQLRNNFPYDYDQIGFKAGLEIHAQLSSKRKLFCHCTPELISPKADPDYHFERRFRPVLGEMGTFDAGMLVEFEKSYRVIYETYGDHICTYEMDETPPFYPDYETIRNGYVIGHFLNCKSAVDEIIFNRKQYLDGSIPTGFQRTAIIARDGFITLKNGKEVRINNVLIEEDAARRVEFIDRANRTVYFNLDRLGIPLTEIITNHEDCNHPYELMEIAILLGLSLRVLGVKKEGIGTIRQDVNISVKGGARVELKGIQDIENIMKYSNNEISRQLALIKIKDQLISRGVSEDDFQPNFIDVTSSIIEKQEDTAFAVRLPRCSGIFLIQVQPHKNFAEEIFDRCELITGISLQNMASSDKPRPWLDQNRVFEVMNVSERDAFIVIRGKKDSVLQALNRLLERMKHALKGVPEETRRVNNKNFNSEFLRVIHGKDRMYSDTDTPPISIDLTIRENKHNPVLTPWEIYLKYDVNIFELKFIITEGFYREFSNLCVKFPEKVRSILGLVQECKYLIKKFSLNYESLNRNGFEAVLEDIIKKNISKDDLEKILRKLNKNDLFASIRENFLGKFDRISEDQSKRIKNILLEFNNKSKRPLGEIFGIIRNHFPMLSTDQILDVLKEQKIIQV